MFPYFEEVSLTAPPIVGCSAHTPLALESGIGLGSKEGIFLEGEGKPNTGV